MDRSTKVSQSPAPFAGDDDIYGSSPAPPSRRNNENVPPASMSPSPVASVSSDKENRSARLDKGKGKMPMGPPAQTPSANEGNKRKRTAERDTPVGRQSSRLRTVERDEDGSEGDYDPDQDIEERRTLRKGLRDLSKDVTENRSDYLTAGNTGLRDTLIKADKFSKQVKQTSDATIDARLLVTTADLSYKKTVALTSGDTAQGVDLEDFLSKCRSYMRTASHHDEEDGNQQAPSSTQRRRGANGDEDDEDDDMFNWAYFGRVACMPHIHRPSVPGFLLGPLSVEKRAKRVVVRKAALKVNSIQETRPEVLDKGDIEKSDNSLTTLCTQILARAKKVQADAMRKAEAEHTDEMSQKEIDDLMDRHGIAPDGSLALLKFIINPFSFGQTIENMFYVSFLIRDGKAGINVGDNGMPYLELTEPRDKTNNAHSGNSKHQAVLALDMAEWKEAIELFDIKEPMIRHREEENHSNVGKKGWYA